MPAADVSALVSDAAAQTPDRLAIVEASGRSVTWGELEDEVGRVATGLATLGVLAGSRVVMVLGNSLEFVATYLGVLRARGVAVPVNPGATPTELALLFADCAPRLVVTDDHAATTVREAVDAYAATAAGQTSLRTVVVDVELREGERSYAELRAMPARPTPPLLDDELLAALLYTSGTSGLPRGVMLTHRALMANIEQVAAVEPPMVHGDDVVLGVLPLFHVYGLNAVLGSVLRHRAKLVLADRFDPQDTLDLIDDEAISVVPAAPPVFAHWSRVDLEGRLGPVRMVLSGSAPLSAEVIEEFGARTGVPVHQGYGLTEAAPVVTSTLCSNDPRVGSVGAPLGGIDLRLVDDDGRPVEGDDPGEIQLRGPNLFSGYWPDGADGPDAEGWWSTGDVGFIDDRGDVVLVDRVKELVIVSGFNVYPAEIEAVVGEVDGVRGVAAIGMPDEITGEAVLCFVVAPERDPAAIEAAVRAACEARLARFKVPRRIEVVAELPLTMTGKVQKGRLRGRERRRALSLVDEPGGSVS
ncbi:class I adenylate-forming enzyme family protein [Nocardioides sp. R-C-SC26]|uniref:class I adenylate-forming enzyme family protein n=1 Tax=Nocardioides sp. R-C-SC26 TaxID=2870414 RepID=UPI001E52524A|nr:AMP-binding protein [Nocardioides sp. R-C-SC26]